MKRPLKVPTKLVTKSQFRDLQEKWDAELRASGFVDIERGVDVNELDASTFRGGSEGGHGMEVTLRAVSPTYAKSDRAASDDAGGMHLSLFDYQEAFHESPQARLWARLAQAAHDLSSAFRWRDLLIDVANGMTQVDAAEKYQISRDKVIRLVKVFCECEGFDYESLFSSPHPRPPSEAAAASPAPVRRLSRREIRSLRYTPPTKRVGV